MGDPPTELDTSEPSGDGAGSIGASTDARPIDHTSVDRVDLDRVSADLDNVETALQRLDDGTYWTDEVTGEPIPDDALAADPTTRRSEH